MPGTTKTCQVKMLYGKPCGRELYDDEYCIFHSKHTDKSKDGFQQKLIQLTSKCRGHLLDLNGFIFPDGIIIEVGGPREINFYNSVFQGTFSFNQVHATAKLIFGNAIFKKDVNLDGLVFESEVHFGSAEFEGEVWFRQAGFKDKTYINAQFKKQACFSDATFEKEVDFSRAKFEKEAIFFETKFIFDTECRFEQCTFGASVDFRSCRFEGDTVFQDNFSKGRGNNKIDF